MALTVRHLAELIHGTVVGDDTVVIRAARTLQDAAADDITFLDNPKQGARLHSAKAAAAVVPAGFVDSTKALIQVPDPLLAFAVIVQHLQNKAALAPTGIDPRACVHASAVFGEDVSIDACAVVGAGAILGKRCHLYPGVVLGKNCRLGDDVVLYPNVILYDDTVLGDRVIIHGNTTLGADGFGFRLQDGKFVKVPQLGNVVVGNDVEIGANATIDRGTFGSTIIGDGCKIDNLVQIGHNCRIGKHNVYAAQVGIAGSCSTDDYVMMGGQAGIADHVHIGQGAQVAAKTGVHSDVPAGVRMFLTPAHEEREARRIASCLRKLPEMRRDLLRVLKILGVGNSDAEAPAA